MSHPSPTSGAAADETGPTSASAAASVAEPTPLRARKAPLSSGQSGLPVRMLHDRVLVLLDSEAAERRSSAGIVIPATARMGKRLSWGDVMAVGGNVRSVETGDRVLFDPEDRAEVELHGTEYVLLRERDVHAVASERLGDGKVGLYL